MEFIDYSDFPLISLQNALRKLRELKEEEYGINQVLIEELQTEIIDRKTGFKKGID